MGIAVGFKRGSGERGSGERGSVTGDSMIMMMMMMMISPKTDTVSLCVRKRKKEGVC